MGWKIPENERTQQDYDQALKLIISDFVEDMKQLKQTDLVVQCEGYEIQVKKLEKHN